MSQQKLLFKKSELAYGGSLLTKRKARQFARPLSTKHTMHLVLRSTRAVGRWSFNRPINNKNIRGILRKFSSKYCIQLLSLANVGNHIHLHMRLTNRHTYKPFIRAVTSAIAMAITGVSRWRRKTTMSGSFWDRRPFTRIVIGRSSFLNVRDYIRINQLEATGYTRQQARQHVNWRYTEREILNST